MEQTQIKIAFGVMTPTLATQLKQQGFKYDGEKVRYMEKLRECTMHLKFAGLISDKQDAAIRKKLFTKIKSHVNSKNK
jgi:hypothetical protein